MGTMATQSPFSFLDRLVDRLGTSFQPPAWIIDEGQQRLVLLLNHVLMQEPEAQARLVRQTGRTVVVRWRKFAVRVAATPAGLLELSAATSPPDLTLTLTEESPWSLTQAALRGDKPAVCIAGDVQFAAEINWLVEHVRWDLEEDLSRLIGDAPAHAVGQACRRIAATLRSFSAAKPQGPAMAATAAPVSPQPAAGPPVSSGPGQDGA